MTTQQLRSLCFHTESLAEIRSTLREYATAGWITPIRWRIGGQRGNNGAWAITPSGVDVAARYVSIARPMVLGNVRRPTTAVIEVEWAAQVCVRDIVVALIRAARQTHFVHQMVVRLVSWPPTHEGEGADGFLRIVWSPQVRQEPNWLPWPAQSMSEQRVWTYPLFIERSSGLSIVDRIALFTHAPRVVPLILVSGLVQLENVWAALARAQEVTSSPIHVGDLDDFLGQPTGPVWRRLDGQLGVLQPPEAA